MASIISEVRMLLSMWEGSFSPDSMQLMKESISFWNMGVLRLTKVVAVSISFLVE